MLRDYSVMDRWRPSASTALRLVTVVRLRLVRLLFPHIIPGTGPVCEPLRGVEAQAQVTGGLAARCGWQ